MSTFTQSAVTSPVPAAPERPFDSSIPYITLNGNKCHLTTSRSNLEFHECFRKLKVNKSKQFYVCLRCLQDENITKDDDILNDLEPGKLPPYLFVDNGGGGVKTSHLSRRHAELAAKKLASAVRIDANICGNNIVKKKNDFRVSMMNWVVLDNVPLSYLDSKNFRKMIADCNPNAEVITTESMKTDITNMATFARAKRETLWKDALGNLRDISLTYDKWTSKANVSYSGIVAHWIDDDWELRTCVVWSGPTCSSKSTAQAQLQDLEKVMK